MVFTLAQGPRGLPGERGRPGAAGAAVSEHLAPIFLRTFLICGLLHKP